MYAGYTVMSKWLMPFSGLVSILFEKKIIILSKLLATVTKIVNIIVFALAAYYFKPAPVKVESEIVSIEDKKEEKERREEETDM